MCVFFKSDCLINGCDYKGRFGVGLRESGDIDVSIGCFLSDEGVL